MFLLALGASPALGSPAAGHAPPEMSLDKVLVVGTDGTRWDLLQAAMKSGRAPNLARLGREGFARPSLLEYGPEVLTLSEVGWSSIASGVWPDKHGVDGSKLNMDPRQATKNGYRDFLTRIENNVSDFDTYLASDWANIGLAENGGPIFGSLEDARFTIGVENETLAAWNAGDVEVTDDAERYLRTGDPDASFVYLGLVDETAHLAGSALPAYATAIATTDGRIGRLIRAVRSRPSYPFENWTILVTTDHGQKALTEPSLVSHLSQTPLEITSFVIGSGPGSGAEDREAACGGHRADRPAPTRRAGQALVEARRALPVALTGVVLGLRGRARRPRGAPPGDLAQVRLPAEGSHVGRGAPPRRGVRRRRRQGDQGARERAGRPRCSSPDARWWPRSSAGRSGSWPWGPSRADCGSTPTCSARAARP